MPFLVNNSQRLINVNNILIAPGTPTEVPDDVMENQVVKDLMEEPAEPGSEKKTLEVANDPKRGVQDTSTTGSERVSTTNPSATQQRQQPPTPNQPTPTPQQPPPQPNQQKSEQGAEHGQGSEHAQPRPHQR
jgi:hypothetical protein